MDMIDETARTEPHRPSQIMEDFTRYSKIKEEPVDAYVLEGTGFDLCFKRIFLAAAQRINIIRAKWEQENSLGEKRKLGGLEFPI